MPIQHAEEVCRRRAVVRGTLHPETWIDPRHMMHICTTLSTTMRLSVRITLSLAMVLRRREGVRITIMTATVGEVPIDPWETAPQVAQPSPPRTRTLSHMRPLAQDDEDAEDGEAPAAQDTAVCASTEHNRCPGSTRPEPDQTRADIIC